MMTGPHLPHTYGDITLDLYQQQKSSGDEMSKKEEKLELQPYGNGAVTLYPSLEDMKADNSKMDPSGDTGKNLLLLTRYV